MIRQFTNHLSVAAAGKSHSSRSTRAHWLCVCVLCALAGCAEHTGANENANEPDDVEDASTRDHDSKHEESAGSAAKDDDLAVANGGKGGASGAAPAASAAGHAGVGAAGDASQAAGAAAQGGAGAAGMSAPVVGAAAGAPAAGGANAAGGPAAAGGSGAMASAGAAASPAASGGAATAAAGTSAPGAGAAGAPVPLGPPGSNTAWLGGGQPVPCASDEHCVKSLYTPICNLTKGVCDVCPDMAQENALATRVNACILAASPRCLNDEECRFGDCITSCDGP